MAFERRFEEMCDAVQLVESHFTEANHNSAIEAVQRAMNHPSDNRRTNDDRRKSVDCQTHTLSNDEEGTYCWSGWLHGAVILLNLFKASYLTGAP